MKLLSHYSIQLATLFFVLPVVLGDVSSLKQEDEDFPPKPYAFGYAAGRYPGHIDRTHSEVSDGYGVVQGSYSYIDPKFIIRKYDYTADKNGFHVISNDDVPDLPYDSPVVAAAKTEHFQKYAAIAQAHEQTPEHVPLPADTVAVQYAKNKHLALFEKIAADHARIAAERQAANIEDPHKNYVYKDGFE